MSVRIVRLGSDRHPQEGVRIGTVRHPPRGVPKSEFAAQNWYDVWLPNIAPSPALIKQGRNARSDKEWKAFARQYRREMGDPEKKRVLDLLATLSHTADFSVGCYCADEARCHRAVLRDLLTERGADIVAHEQISATD